MRTGLTGPATMTVFKLDPEVYKRYKDEVLKLCNSFQKIDQPGLSDKQIAERLGLDERQTLVEADRRGKALHGWMDRRPETTGPKLLLLGHDLKMEKQTPWPV